VWGKANGLITDVKDSSGNEVYAAWRGNATHETAYSNRIANAVRHVLYGSYNQECFTPPGMAKSAQSEVPFKLIKVCPPPTYTVADYVDINPGGGNILYNVCPKRALELDILDQLVNLITFRNNYFTVIVGAQVLGNDQKTVVGEKRAVATVYRDAYTGRHFMRSFKWLDE